MTNKLPPLEGLSYDPHKKLAELEAILPPSFKPYAMSIMEYLGERANFSPYTLREHQAFISNATVEAFFASDKPDAHKVAKWIAEEITKFGNPTYNPPEQ